MESKNVFLNLVEEGIIEKVGEDNFVVDCDFCGDDEEKVAISWSKDFDIFVKRVDDVNGMMCFRFMGNEIGIRKLLEVYGF